LFWKNLTTTGAVAGGLTGLAVVAVLIILGPTVWVSVLGNKTPIFPYAYPTLFSVTAAFTVTIVVSLADRSQRAKSERAAFPAQVVRSEIGKH